MMSKAGMHTTGDHVWNGGFSPENNQIFSPFRQPGKAFRRAKAVGGNTPEFLSMGSCCCCCCAGNDQLSFADTDARWQHLTRPISSWRQNVSTAIGRAVDRWTFFRNFATCEERKLAARAFARPEHAPVAHSQWKVDDERQERRRRKKKGTTKKMIFFSSKLEVASPILSPFSKSHFPLSRLNDNERTSG